MNLYQFEKIFSRMSKEFGKIVHGEESGYRSILMPMEIALLRTHREHPRSNSQRLKEALALVLFDIQSRYTGETPDLSAFRNVDNERLENALLMVFDPFTSEQVRQSMEEDPDKKVDLSTPDQKRKFFAPFIRCIVRLRESIDIQEKRMGSNGYFDFLEEIFGNHLEEMLGSYLED